MQLNTRRPVCTSWSSQTLCNIANLDSPVVHHCISMGAVADDAAHELPAGPVGLKIRITSSTLNGRSMTINKRTGITLLPIAEKAFESSDTVDFPFDVVDATGMQPAGKPHRPDQSTSSGTTLLWLPKAMSYCPDTSHKELTGRPRGTLLTSVLMAGM